MAAVDVLARVESGPEAPPSTVAGKGDRGTGDVR